MSRKTLKALFHMDDKAYKEEYEHRFNDENTIHLPIDIGKEQAFVCLTYDIFERIISIERLDKKVSHLYRSLPGVAIKQFTKKCMIDEILLTNDIEGVRSTRKEVSEILQNISKQNRKKRLVGLAAKYSTLMSGQDISFKTCKDIRKIYNDMFYEEVKAADPKNLPDGDMFRKSGVDVLTAAQEVIHKGVVPESSIKEKLTQSLSFLNNENIDIFIRIAVFHYLFGYIHPFYDGNGRTSRFISSYLLSKHLTPLIGFRLSYTIKENISKYYKAFEVCNDCLNKGELTPFVEMFLNIVKISMEQLSETLTEKLDRLKYYKDRINILPNSNKSDIRNLYYLLIQAALFSDIGVSREEIRLHMKISINTVSKKIKQIPEYLLLEKIQKNKKHYILDLDKVNELLSQSSTS